MLREGKHEVDSIATVVKETLFKVLKHVRVPLSSCCIGQFHYYIRQKSLGVSVWITSSRLYRSCEESRLYPDLLLRS